MPRIVEEQGVGVNSEGGGCQREGGGTIIAERAEFAALMLPGLQDQPFIDKA
jgi:hypothetical protein